MRKSKIITTQHHIIIIVEIDDENQEATCNTVSANSRGMYPTSTTAFLFEGSATAFLKNDQNQWEWSGESFAPGIKIIAANVVLGSSTSSSFFRVIGIQPKKQDVLERWGYPPEQIDMILDVDNEDSFLDVLSFMSDKKMDSNTFVAIESSNIVSNSEITYI